VISRRSFLAYALTTGGVARLSRTQPLALGGPLACQLHAVRGRAAGDFPGTLRTIAALGYTEVEIVSFRGYASPAPRDGFGRLAPLSPTVVRATIDGAGLRVTSAHFKYEELQGPRLDDSLGWARGVGLRYMTVSDLPSVSTLGEWRRIFGALNELGARVGREEMQLGLHTQNNLWSVVDGVVVIDALLRGVEPASCSIQLDLSTTQSMRVDPVAFLRTHGTRCFSLHLRDAPTPAQPGGYLYAVPLGMGHVDLPGVLTAARAAGIGHYVVEMQVEPPADPVDALRLSAQYFRSLQLD
jgi:sugar phosphate isomerase/epimerase